MSTEKKVIMGAFRAFNHARDAVVRLEASGVRPEQISLVAPEGAHEEIVRIEKGTKAAEGAGIGGAAGVALGGLVAGLTAVAALSVTGVGVLAAGPLVAALAGAGAGGAAGGALGALIGLGVPEHEAKFHTSVLDEGGFIVVVMTDDEAEQKSAREILDELSVKSDSVKGTAARVASAP